MSGFTYLERSVLDSIGTRYGAAHPGIAERMRTAVYLSRENTGHGFYTEFVSSAGTPEPSWPTIECPYARMVHMGNGAIMGFILWVGMNGANTLEGFQFGDAAGEYVDLKARNLADLDFSELEWQLSVLNMSRQEPY